MADVQAANLSDVSIMAAETDLIAGIPAQSPISWHAVVAGAFASAALTLLLIAFGAGMGFSAVSPWSNSGVSSTTFSIGTGLYLIVTAMLASTVGGYVAGRLRAPWPGPLTDEIFFQDTAHGFIAWACATVLSAAALGAAASTIVAGASGGLTQRTAADGGPAAIYVDELFRPAPNAAIAPNAVVAPKAVDTLTRAEVDRLLMRTLRNRGDLSAADAAYLAQLVASRTGLGQADARSRVSEIVNEAKSDIDKARAAAAKLSLWLTAALLAGALASSLAAIEGGQLRDRRL